MEQRSVVLIGPAAVGKSTVGRLLADSIGRTFVDLDEIAGGYYAEVDQPVDALIERIASHGLREAHRWWQPARSHAVDRCLVEHRGAVVALGAGHSHFEDEQFADHVAEALAGCFVILLLPHADPMVSETVLRARCASERGEAWGGVEFLQEWVTSSQNAALADAVVYATSMTPTEIALHAAGAIPAGRR